MRASVLAIFPRFYGAAQTASAALYVAHLDPLLLADGTYYVHESDGEIVSCGGWSRRALLYAGSGSGNDDARLLNPATEPARIRAMFVHGSWTRRGLGREILDASERAAAAEGFRTLTLMATRPGVPLYAAFGFVAVRLVELTLVDGTRLDGTLMERPVRCAPA
jgi:GNAT superfamily N-acetyltransferase